MPNPSPVWLLAVTLVRPELISFAAGLTDSEFLPTRDARALLDE